MPGFLRVVLEGCKGLSHTHTHTHCRSHYYPQKSHWDAISHLRVHIVIVAFSSSGSSGSASGQGPVLPQTMLVGDKWLKMVDQLLVTDYNKWNE